MKKTFLLLIVAALGAQPLQAQGLLNKIKSAAKESKGDNVSTTLTDEWGISGNYTLSSDWDVRGKKIKKFAVEFVKEENGTIVNRLTMNLNSDKTDRGVFKLDEKAFDKQGLKLFTGGIGAAPGASFEVLALADGVLFLNCTSQKGYVVLAKNPEDLKTWDEETGLAKYEAEKKKSNAAASSALRKKLEDYEAYKKNVGKVVFAKNRNDFFAAYRDQPSEKTTGFINEWKTGDALYMRGYFDKAYSEVCGSCDGKINIVLEMGKHKVDWMELRGSKSAFNKMFVPSTLSNEYMTGAVWLWDNIDYNRALTMVIYKNVTDGVLKEGGALPLKVTMYSYADKTNGTKIAEGTISVKYTGENGSWPARYRSFKEAVE